MSRELAALRNLGPASATMLVKAGIDSVAALQELGAVTAFLRVRQAGLQPSLNLLWALEGALSDRPWQQVAREERFSLLTQLETLQHTLPAKP